MGPLVMDEGQPAAALTGWWGGVTLNTGFLSIRSRHRRPGGTEMAMQATELRIGHVYAYPLDASPWCRHAAPARLMARRAKGRALVLVPDGIPSTPVRDAVPRGSLVWVDADGLACLWNEWPERARRARESALVAVSSAVAAIGGQGAPELVGRGIEVTGMSPFTRARVALNRWARPEPRPLSLDDVR